MHAIPGNFFEILPGLELSELINILFALLLSSLRIGSFLISSPLLGYRIIPVQVRVICSFALVLVIFSHVQIPNINEIAGISLFLTIAIEIMIGLSAGTILTILFSSATVAGEKIAMSSGLSFAGLIDPESGGQTPVLSQIMSLFVIIIFLSLNGHLVAISTILESYKVIPVGLANFSYDIIKLGIDAGALMFKFGALISLPAILGLTLVNVIIGIVTRSAPTLNLFSFGFPITMMTAFFFLYLIPGPISHNISKVVETSLDMIFRIIEGLY